MLRMRGPAACSARGTSVSEPSGIGPAYGWIARCPFTVLDVGYDMFVERFRAWCRG
jgi:hypothetical protein